MHEAASNALCDLYSYCLPSNQVDLVIQLVFDPLEN